MPTYTFKHNETGDIVEHVLRMSELDSFKAAHPELTQTIVSAGAIVRDGGNMRPDDNFRDVLKSIKKASGKNNTINTF